MKLTSCVLLLLAVSAAAVSDEERFAGWMKTWGKSYASAEEHGVRFGHFKANLAKVHALTAGERPDPVTGRHTFGLTKFSDMSATEFKATHLNYVPRANRDLAATPVATPGPSQFAAGEIVDWRTKGGVTPVKDQGQCGSCWAFSATEEIESMSMLKTGVSKVLSPQQIVSCDTGGYDYGCNGGDTVTAFDYVKAAGGIQLASDYPYTSGRGTTGTCKVDNSKLAVQISGYTYATPGCYNKCTNQDINLLNQNLASHGPASICVDASVWQHYTSGVLSSNCKTSYNALDHCVQLVGSNFNVANPYWIVRNSWAEDWGVGGYIYVDAMSNACGVADEANFVQVV